MTGLSVVLLCHNRTKSSREAIVTTAMEMDGINCTELVVCDNSSRVESTIAIKRAVEKCREKLRTSIRYVRTEADCGVGRNIYSGVISSSYENILFMDNRSQAYRQLITGLLCYVGDKKKENPPIGFVKFVEGTISKTEGVMVEEWPAGEKGGSLAFNRGSTLAGCIISKERFALSEMALDRGIYPHVRPLMYAGLMEGIFVVCGAGLLDTTVRVYHDQDSGAYDREDCLGLKELIGYAIEYVDTIKKKDVKCDDMYKGSYGQKRGMLKNVSKYNGDYHRLLNSLLMPKYNWVLDLATDVNSKEKGEKAMEAIKTFIKEHEYNEELRSIFKWS